MEFLFDFLWECKAFWLVVRHNSQSDPSAGSVRISDWWSGTGQSDPSCRQCEAFWLVARLNLANQIHQQAVWGFLICGHTEIMQHLFYLFFLVSVKCRYFFYIPILECKTVANFNIQSIWCRISSFIKIVKPALFSLYRKICSTTVKILLLKQLYCF